MLKKFSLALILFFPAAVLFSQKPSVKYSGSLAVGVLVGENNNNIQLQVVNGVRYKTWSAGLGVGLDDYYTRSVPLFLQVKKAFHSKPETPFVYVDAGANLPYLKEAEKAFVEKSRGGFYGEAGIGYEMTVLKKHGLFFGLGWRVKKYSLKINSAPYLSVWPTPEWAYRYYDYTHSSLALKLGFRF